MSSKSRKILLFEAGKKALANVLDPPLDSYICPLCLELFASTEELTLEHVPPKSLGGKSLCLTCAPCNSIAGHGIESHLHRQQRFSNFLREGGRQERATLFFGDLSLNVHADRNNNSIELIVPRDRNRPVDVKVSAEKIKSHFETGAEFKLSKRSKFDNRAVDAAYLKAAYLAAFAKFGYRWILSEHIDPVRNQIREPHETHAALFRIFLKESQTMPERILLLAEKPNVCLFIKIGTTAILLPWIHGTGAGVFEWLAEQRRQDTSLDFKFSMAWEWPTSMEMILDRLPTND